MTEGVRGPREVLLERGLRAKQPFGQNFLADRNLARRIAELATTPPGGTVVEIGAGTGALTRELAQRAALVVAVERDRDLVPVLGAELSVEVAGGRVLVLEADAKQVDYPALLRDGPAPRVVAGNLPYQLTGPLLERTVALAPVIDRAVYMVQREVGDRLTADPGTHAYGALTVFLQAAFTVERALVVRRGAFYPQPGVDSLVVVLTPLRPPVTEETTEFRAVVKAAFSQRRKTLRNAWKSVLGQSSAEVAQAAAAAGIELDLRGETLSVEQFARMAAGLRIRGA